MRMALTWKDIYICIYILFFIIRKPYAHETWPPWASLDLHEATAVMVHKLWQAYEIMPESATLTLHASPSKHEIKCWHFCKLFLWCCVCVYFAPSIERVVLPQVLKRLERLWRGWLAGGVVPWCQRHGDGSEGCWGAYKTHVSEEPPFYFKTRPALGFRRRTISICIYLYRTRLCGPQQYK